MWAKDQVAIRLFDRCLFWFDDYLYEYIFAQERSTFIFPWHSGWPCSFPNATYCLRKWISGRTVSTPRVSAHSLKLCSGTKCKSDSDSSLGTRTHAHAFIQTNIHTHTHKFRFKALFICALRFSMPISFRHTLCSTHDLHPRAHSFASAYVYMHLDGRIQAIGNTGKDTQTIGAEEDGDPLPESDPSGEVREGGRKEGRCDRLLNLNSGVNACSSMCRACADSIDCPYRCEG